MEEVPWRINYAAERLAKGHRINRMTVRDFLRLFGAERRGAAKVEAIREVLNSLNLETDPDFESVWIDEPIWLRLRGNHSHQDTNNNEDTAVDIAPPPAEQPSNEAPTSTEPSVPVATTASESADPTFRIGNLPAANKSLVTVNQDDDVAKAATLMLQYDFSQLPVMQGDREVKGVVTWKTIARRKLLASDCQRVGDCQEEARIVDSNRTLFDVIPTIVESGYVLVRQHDRRISGIVTSSDLSLQFQILAEPFLLLREVELHIRQILRGKLEAADFQLFERPVTERPPKEISEMTFGQYVRVLDEQNIWGKLNLKIDRLVLRNLLDEVRQVRNEVMHFDPDPMSPDQLALLKRAVRLMQEVYPLVRQN